VNETYENAGYGTGGISWLTHTSFNQTNLLENNAPMNPFIGTCEVEKGNGVICFAL
jgi:hypothetical protein